MGRKLTDKTTHDEPPAVRLTKPKVSFKIALESKIDKGYCFSKLKEKHLKDFQNFLDQTVYKNLTISEVDKLFLRTKGKVKSVQKICGVKRDVVHYGKDKKPFRIHGYYNDDGYFVIYKIDPSHSVHKE